MVGLEEKTPPEPCETEAMRTRRKGVCRRHSTHLRSRPRTAAVPGDTLQGSPS